MAFTLPFVSPSGDSFGVLSRSLLLIHTVGSREVGSIQGPAGFIWHAYSSLLSYIHWLHLVRLQPPFVVLPWASSGALTAAFCRKFIGFIRCAHSRLLLYCHGLHLVRSSRLLFYIHWLHLVRSQPPFGLHSLASSGALTAAFCRTSMGFIWCAQATFCHTSIGFIWCAHSNLSSYIHWLHLVRLQQPFGLHSSASSGALKPPFVVHSSASSGALTAAFCRTFISFIWCAHSRLLSYIHWLRLVRLQPPFVVHSLASSGALTAAFCRTFIGEGFHAT